MILMSLIKTDLDLFSNLDQSVHLLSNCSFAYCSFYNFKFFLIEKL